MCTCVWGRMRPVCVIVYIWACMPSVLAYLAVYAFQQSTMHMKYSIMFQTPFPPQLTVGILVLSQMVNVVAPVQLTHPQ